MSDNLTIGQRLALLRKARSLTQQALSDITGKSRGIIAQIEKDMVKPDHEFIGSFVRNLNIPYEWVFEPSEAVQEWLSKGYKLPEDSTDFFDEKGGNLIDKKGGNLRGNLTPEKENEKYIKTKESGGQVIQEKGGQVRGQVMPQKGHIHSHPEALEEERAPYSKENADITSDFIYTHTRVVNKLLDRIDELEEIIKELSPERKKQPH